MQPQNEEIAMDDKRGYTDSESIYRQYEELGESESDVVLLQDGEAYNKSTFGEENGASTSSIREQLLNKVENLKLKNAINEIYRPGANVGDGGLADAVRYELPTKELIGGKSHE